MDTVKTMDLSCMNNAVVFCKYTNISVMKKRSKKITGGTKSTVSVSDEKVQANQDRVYF